MKTFVITGAASGIGAATKAKLDSAGHRTISLDIHNADIVADLATAEGRQAAIEQVIASVETIDGLVCCAGLGVTAPSAEMIVAVNYYGLMDLIHGLTEHLARQDGAAITVIGSFAATQQVHQPDALSLALIENDANAVSTALSNIAGPHVAYSASKYAVTVASRRLVSVLGKQGVRINIIAPGAVATPLHQASLNDPTFGQAVKNFVSPLGAHTDPNDIASLVSYVHSEAASFMHGSVLFVDGGMDAMLRPTQF